MHKPKKKRRSPPRIRRCLTVAAAEICSEVPRDLAVELRARWIALSAAIETARSELSVIDGLQADAARANRENLAAGRGELVINLSALRREALASRSFGKAPSQGTSRSGIRADRLLQAVMNAGRPAHRRLLGNGG